MVGCLESSSQYIAYTLARRYPIERERNVREIERRIAKTTRASFRALFVRRRRRIARFLSKASHRSHERFNLTNMPFDGGHEFEPLKRTLCSAFAARRVTTNEGTVRFRLECQLAARARRDGLSTSGDDSFCAREKRSASWL